MYKNSVKSAQRISGKARNRVDSLTPRRKSTRRLKAEITTAKAIPKTNRCKNKLIDCPSCGKQLQRSVRVIQQHFLQIHTQQITEAEAYRIASPQKTGRRAPYAEGLSKDPRVVSGGLPSLGKRR